MKFAMVNFHKLEKNDHDERSSIYKEGKSLKEHCQGVAQTASCKEMTVSLLK